MPLRHQRLKQFLSIFLVFMTATLAQANTQALVDTAWLSQHLADKDVAIIDMSDTLQYQRFHIPGARYLPYEAINRQTQSGIAYSVGPENVAAILAQLGITPRHHIVIYDDTGGLNAARLYWELQRLQHAHASILDGGLVQWVRDGRKVSWEPTNVKPATYTPGKIDQSLLATKNDITKVEILLDVRSQEEYQGQSYTLRSGHIPGAYHFPWDEAVDFENSFRMKPVAELKAALAQRGITEPSREVTLYCHSGHRAAHTFFTLRRLGWNRVRVYDGSMAEYAQDKSAALKKGNTP